MIDNINNNSINSLIKNIDSNNVLNEKDNNISKTDSKAKISNAELEKIISGADKSIVSSSIKIDPPKNGVDTSVLSDIQNASLSENNSISELVDSGALSSKSIMEMNTSALITAVAILLTQLDQSLSKTAEEVRRASDLLAHEKSKAGISELKSNANKALIAGIALNTAKIAGGVTSGFAPKLIGDKLGWADNSLKSSTLDTSWRAVNESGFGIGKSVADSEQSEGEAAQKVNELDSKRAENNAEAFSELKKIC